MLMARNIMTRQEERTLLELLQSAGEAVGDGLWRYHDGQNEQWVLAQLNVRYSQRPLPFTLMHVAGYRREVFGQIVKAPTPQGVSRHIEDRLDELASRLHKLEAWAAARPRVPFIGQ